MYGPVLRSNAAMLARFCFVLFDYRPDSLALGTFCWAGLCRSQIAFLRQTRLPPTDFPNGLGLIHRGHQKDLAECEATQRIGGDGKHG